MPGSSSTNAPKSVTRVTFPRTRSPSLYFPANRIPRMRQQLLHPQRDPLRPRIDLHTFTSICCPTVNTSAGFSTRAHAISLYAADHPPHPYRRTRHIHQTPHRARDVSPSLSRSSAAPSSSGLPPRHRAPIDDHVLLLRSSLMIRQRISCPTSFSISAASRAPLREPGINARTPTSTSARPSLQPLQFRR